ncbi:HNH endonuclease [Aeromonas sp. AE23HZ002T15]
MTLVANPDDQTIRGSQDRPHHAEAWVALGKPWIEEELRAAVAAYSEMRKKEQARESYTKRHYYAELAERFGRTEKAFEYRMQNISYLYALLGLTWVSGLKPAKNVGPQHTPILERLICEQEGLSYTGLAEFEHKVIAYQARPDPLPPAGIQDPKPLYSAATSYARDPKVKAWVLMTAAGLCECCDKPAPFTTTTGAPFLEVHHLRTLADGGSDTIGNTVALCPNCHRALHYGADQGVLREALYQKLVRLVRE